MGRSGEDENLQITGGADDIEYFDNGNAGTPAWTGFGSTFKERNRGSSPLI